MASPKTKTKRNCALGRVVKPRYQTCRAYGHAWEPIDVEKESPTVYLQHLRCIRCQVERTIEINAKRFESRPRGYRYTNAPDYLLKGGRLTIEEKTRLRMSELERTVQKPRLRLVRHTG